MITYGIMSNQFSFAPPPEHMMAVDPTLRPENVTASVGDLMIVVFSSGSGMRIPEPDKEAMEVSWAGEVITEELQIFQISVLSWLNQDLMVFREFMIK